MRKSVLYIFSGLIVVVMILLADFMLSSYFGWFGYNKNERRISSRDIDESRSRGTFIRSLNYRFINYDSSKFEFHPFIERGFKYGNDNSYETILIEGSAYPYQLAFNSTPLPHVTLILDSSQYAKFDSCNGRGYLREPMLKDTILIDIIDVKDADSHIMVW